MKSLLVCLAFLCGLLSISVSGFAKDKKKDQGNIVTLGMLDPSLEKADSTAVDAFVVDSNKVTFEQTGVEKYDSFFKEVAIIAGTTIELRFILTQLDSNALTIDELRPVLDFGWNALPKMKERIPAILEQAKAFKPSEDFTGLKKTKVPGVTAGIAKATETLNRSAAESIAILERLTGMQVPVTDESKE